MPIMISTDYQGLYVELPKVPNKSAKYILYWREPKSLDWKSVSSHGKYWFRIASSSIGKKYKIKAEIEVDSDDYLFFSEIKTVEVRDSGYARYIDPPLSPKGTSYIWAIDNFSWYIKNHILRKRYENLSCRGLPIDGSYPIEQLPDCILADSEGVVFFNRNYDKVDNNFDDKHSLINKENLDFEKLRFLFDYFFESMPGISNSRKISLTKKLYSIDFESSRYLNKYTRFGLKFDLNTNSSLSDNVKKVGPSYGELLLPNSSIKSLTIFSSGHANAFIGYHDIVNWFLERGHAVAVMPMPLVGTNKWQAERLGFEEHNSLAKFGFSVHDFKSVYFGPLKTLVTNVKNNSINSMLNLRLSNDPPIQIIPKDIPILLAGISGGGWQAYVYGAIDPRIDYVISAAGGVPNSMRRRNFYDIGDYEQNYPDFYGSWNHFWFMATAGRKGSVFLFNELDTCCYKISSEDHPFMVSLQNISSKTGRKIHTMVDRKQTHHSISSDMLVRLEEVMETWKL